MRKWFALLFLVAGFAVVGCSKDPGEEVNPPDPTEGEMMEMEKMADPTAGIEGEEPAP